MESFRTVCGVQTLAKASKARLSAARPGPNGTQTAGGTADEGADDAEALQPVTNLSQRAFQEYVEAILKRTV